MAMNAKDLIQKRNIIEDKKNKQLEIEGGDPYDQVWEGDVYRLYPA